MGLVQRPTRSAARCGPRMFLSVGLLALSIVGCGQVQPSTPGADATLLPSANATLPPGEIALPAGRPASSGTPQACAGVGLAAVLHGDAHDPRIAWLVDDTRGTRLDVTWPPGYRARFAPKLEVVDASGTVVLRDGDPVTGACVTSDPNVHQLEPPFN